MTEFSVNTRNRFALGFDDEEDTDLYELLEKEQEDKKKKAQEAEEAAKLKAAASKGKKDKRSTTNVKNSNKKVPIKSSENSSSNTQTQQSSHHDNTTTTKRSSNNYYSRNDENRPPRLRNSYQNRPSSSNENMNFEKPPQETDGRERRGGPVSFRGGRGGSRGGFGGRQRREFERHSGSDKTGVKAVEKRDGFGPHNWGGEISSQLDQSTDREADLSTDQVPNGNIEEGETPSGDGPTEQEESAPEVPKEPETFTLEEYKAKQAQLAKPKPAFTNLRKANEGADTKQWKKYSALEKKKKGEESDEEYEEYTDDEDAEVEGTKANLEKLNIQITFADRSDRRGRGGRGRGFGPPRGGRFARGGGSGGQDGGSDRKGGRGKTNVPQIDNENFPSLGSR